MSCNVGKKTTFNPSFKFAPAKLQQDFLILQKVLQHNHPSLYWYATSDSVNGYFSAIQASLKDSLTEQDFKNRISWAIDKIHCGHTTVRPSKRYVSYYSKQKLPQFPLLLKVWDDSAVVVANLLRTDTVLKRGSIVTSINGFAMKQITDSISQLIGTDGYSKSFKYQVISFNFPAYYKNSFGTDSQYVVTYIDTAGKLKSAILQNYDPKDDTADKKSNLLIPDLPKKQFKTIRLTNDRNLRIDTALNTAFLSVNTFSEGRLIRFFKRSFKKIRKQNITNLVVDLRLNSGGNVLACTRLSQYLVEKPFHVADTVAAFTRSFPNKKYIKPWFIYWLSMHISGRKYADERIHFRYFERHSFKPKTTNHFNGNIYLLTGGYTFSAATLVAGSLKGQNNVKIVGEETGGGAYGNSAMFLTNIVLPNTGIRITLPLYRMVLQANLPKNGRGVLPDIEVKPSSTIIKMGVDAKLEKVKELIKESR